MLLYDIPLIKSSLSIKCIGGLFTKPKSLDLSQIKSQLWLPKIYAQVIVAKTTSFQLYRLRKSLKAEKIDMQFVNSTDVFGQICNIEVCTVKMTQSKQFIDIVIVTLNTGELLVYNYSRDEKKFICSFRDIIFKQKYQNSNIDNPRNVGNYISCSEQNHFLISSVRSFKKLYSVSATQYQQKIRVNIKAQDLYIKQNHVCWNVIWLPSMINQLDYYGKYVSIQKPVLTLQNQTSYESMIDQKQQNKTFVTHKKLSYLYVQKNHKLYQRQQKLQGYKKLNETAHMLIPLSASSYFIMYQNRLRLRQLMNQSKQQPKQQLIDCQFPLRQALVDKNIKCIFSAYSRQTLQDKKNIIYLVNQFGDLFKVQYSLIGTYLANLSLKYVNSVKTVHSIIYVGQVDKNQINLLGNDPVKVKHQTATVLVLGLQRFSVSLYFLLPTQSVQSKPKQTRVAIRPLGKPKATKNYPQYSDKQSFKPIAQRSKDLQISDQIQHMGVIIDTKVANLIGSLQKDDGKGTQQNFQIFALTNSGNLRHEEHIDQTIDTTQLHKSHLKIIKKGLKIKQINSLEGPKLQQIFCFKKSQKQPHHKIVALCMNGKTVVYTIANDTFTNNKQLLIEQNATTIYMGKFEDESFVQVVGNKIRHIKRQKNATKEHAIKNKIVHAISSGKQLFIALYGGQIIFSELDRQKESIETRKQFYANDEIVAMQLTPIQNNKIDQTMNKRASRFLIIGTKTYQIIIYKQTFKSQKQTNIQQIYSENVTASIQSIASIIVMNDQNNPGQKIYQIYLGMDNGSMIKMEFDRNMKKISSKIISVGSKSVKVKRCSIGSKRQDSLLITSDKSFIYYNYNGKYKMHLIACSNIDIATQMRQPQNPNTIITFHERNPQSQNKDYIRMLSIQSFGQDFHDQKVDLFFSGKKLLVFQNNIGIIEADPSYQKMKKRKPQNNDIDVENNFIEIQNLQKTWKSQFTIYKVKDAKKIAAIYFDQTKQICICAAYNSIKSGPNQGNYLIFGCAQGMSYYPKMQAKQQTIKIYSWVMQKKANQKQNQYKTQFLYSLNIDAIQLVIQPFFKGQKFLIGIGKTLRMYQIGKKKLLLKAQTKNLPSYVNQIKTIGKKIFITSVSDSFHLFKYIPQEKTFYDIAQDQLPKYITAMNIVDSQTVCAADKFGNLFVGRLTQNAKTQFENASGSSKTLQSGHLCKFNTVARINVGQIITSIQKVSLYTSKVDVILYSTVLGQIRVLYPLTQYQQVKVLPLIQQKMRQKLKIKQVQGNNWGASKNIIIGQYIQRFLNMPENDQKQVLKQTQIIDQNYLDYVKDMIEGIRNKII